MGINSAGFGRNWSERKNFNETSKRRLSWDVVSGDLHIDCEVEVQAHLAIAHCALCPENLIRY